MIFTSFLTAPFYWPENLLAFAEAPWNNSIDCRAAVKCLSFLLLRSTSILSISSILNVPFCPGKAKKKMCYCTIAAFNAF